MPRGEAKEDYSIPSQNSQSVAAATEPIAHPVSPQRVSFELITAPGGVNMWTAIFTVPPGLENILAKHSVNARGAQFELSVGSRPCTLFTTFYSSDPNTTAEAIRSRLDVRISDPSPPGADECSIM